MGLKELIAKKYDEEVKTLEDTIEEKEKVVLETTLKEKEKSLGDLKEQLKKFKDFEGRYTYFVERNDGERVVVHRKGDKVLFFSSNGRDITPKFENRGGAHRDLVEQAKSLSKEDFIIDCTVIDKRHGEYCFYVSDVLFLGNDLRVLGVADRKKHVKKLSFSDDFKESPSVKIKRPTDLNSTLELFSKLEANSLVIKRRNSQYILGNSDEWISFEVKQDGIKGNRA